MSRFDFDNIYKDFGRQMTYHLVKLADENRLTSGDSHALWYPFFGKAANAFPEYKLLQKGIKEIRKGKKTTTEVLHEISDNKITIHYVGMRGKTLFNWMSSHILPTIVKHMTWEDFITKEGIYLKISEPPYEIFPAASIQQGEPMIDSQGNVNAVFKVVKKLKDKEIKYDCKDVLGLIMCGASIDGVDNDALLGFASTKVERLYASLLLYRPTEDGSSLKEANAVIVGKFIKQGQIILRETLTGGIEVYQLVEVAPEKYKMVKAKLEELTKHYNQYFVPTLNLDRDVRPHSVSPEDISEAIVSGTSGGEIRFTEDAKIFTDVLHAVKAKSPKIKSKFIDELRKGGGGVKIEEGVLNVVQPFGDLETGEISTYSHLLIDSTIHYLLAGANPLAVLLTGYNERMNRPNEELKGEFGSTTIQGIKTCLQDLMRLFEPPPLEFVPFNPRAPTFRRMRGETVNSDSDSKTKMWQYLLDDMVVKVDSEDAYSVSEAYFKILTNLLYYQAAYKRITDMFDLPQTGKAPPAR